MAKYKAPRIAGGLFRLFFTLLLISVCSILAWRIFFSTRIPNEVETLAPNQALSEAYAVHGDNLTLRYQELSSITRAQSNYGYFSVESCVFIPEAEQVQIIFRYNNSTIRHLAQDKDLPAIPDKSEHLFDVSLVRATDLTPADKNDNLDATTLQTERILPSGEPVRAETSLYTYYRYVFDGVTVEDITDAIYIDVYYIGDINYAVPAYGTLCVYAWDEEWISYRPTKADRAAFTAIA